MIGGGGASNDAANLLKPALAQGELRTIAATTFAEYKKYIEKDPPFAQRFGLVKLDEPSVTSASQCCAGRRTSSNTIIACISDDAIRRRGVHVEPVPFGATIAAESGFVARHGPRPVAVGLNSTPGPLEDIRRRIIQIDTATKAIERDAEAGHGHDPDELQRLKTEGEQQQRSFDELDMPWKARRELAQNVIRLREELAAARDGRSNGRAAKPTAEPAAPNGSRMRPAEISMSRP